MKSTFFSFLFFFGILFIACNPQKKPLVNQFSSTADTLVIQTTKQKGDGMFPIGTVEVPFKAITSEFPYEVSYPKEITDIKRFLFTPNLREKRPLYVDIITGIQNNNDVFIVDENNNKDLTDDTIRPVEEIDWFSHKNLVKCTYVIADGSQDIQESSWLKVGLSNNNLSVGRSDYIQGVFSIDQQTFKIVAAEPFNFSFTYDISPQLAVIQHENIKKDSITNRDIVNIGAYVQLGNNHYKFISSSVNGTEIILIKEKNFDKKIGSQIGMLAPEFKVVSTQKDTIKSSDFHDKITLIANSCGCGGDKASTQAYYDIQSAYPNMNILHVDSNIKKTDNGFHIDVENDFNKDFYQKYRGQYCSRICYVIGKNNRILYTFVIYNWKTALGNIPKQ